MTEFFRRLIGRRWGRWLIVLAGIIAGQTVLYGPSLIGNKILLPLDTLAMPGIYVPITPERRGLEPHDNTSSDRVLQFEPARQFAVEEIRAGRFPLWIPSQYAGAPFIWLQYSPIHLLGWCVKSPVILAWIHLLNAIVAGLGAYVFLRHVLKVGFWAAAIPAWCYPLTGFFVFWEGNRVDEAILWFPWLLLAVDRVVRQTSAWALAALSVATYLTLVSGQIDVAGQALLVSGLYAVWCLGETHRGRWWSRVACKSVLVLIVGWLLGFSLAAPYVFPLVEYARSGIRMERRIAGEEERPPTGLSALPQTVLPDLYGANRNGSYYIAKGVQTESAAAAYTGLVATLFIAPLAWCSRRHRSSNMFWLSIGFLALSWSLNVPGLVTLMRLPGMNMMSHNRLTFAATFAILTMTAVGLDVLCGSNLEWRRWFWLPAAFLASLFGWSIYRAVVLPEPVATQLGVAVERGAHFEWIQRADDVGRLQSWFIASSSVAAVLCYLGIIGWVLVWMRPTWLAKIVPLLGILLVADLLWFAHDRSAQCDPALYYPRIPALEDIARARPGRVVGRYCLPSMLAGTEGLSDVRGYDGVDPSRFVQLMTIAAADDSPFISYAQLQYFTPRVALAPPDGVRLSPILDLLNVRYVIFRGAPPPELRPVFQSPDYWVLENPTALPRAFVPSRVETVVDAPSRLEKLASPQFNPREVAYVELPVELPKDCRGVAEIISEIPTRVTLAVTMETPGLVVLADRWDKGWHAYLNGALAPIARVNHAIRGVIVPAGNATLEFRYEPASFARGLQLATAAAVALLASLLMTVWQRRYEPL